MTELQTKAPGYSDDELVPVAPEKSAEEITLPQEGDTFEQDGVVYELRRVDTGTQVWDEFAEQLVPRYHSLRTWFSVDTDGIGPGPGWDDRFSLLDMSREERLRRYGYAFDEPEQIIDAPATLPDDIPYLAAVQAETKKVQDLFV